MSAWTAPLLLAASLAAAPARERLVLEPEPGTHLAKDYELHHALIVEENELLGREVEQISLDRLELESRLKLRIRDVFRAVADGRPTVFRRHYDRIELEAQASQPSPSGPMSDLLEAQSSLAGKSVVFTWQDDLGEYGRYYDVEEAAEEHLPRLAVDVNLACLLPGREVAPGDEWSIPPAALRDVLGYGGELELVFGRSGSILLARALMFGVGGSLWHVFEGQSEGGATARFEEVREIDGRRTAVVHLDLDVRFAVDQTELMRQKRNAVELTGKIDIQRATLDLALKGGGELLWDLERNVPYRLELVAEETVEVLRELAPPPPETPVLHPTTPSQRMKLRGVLRLDLNTQVLGS
jgi:hypothetical protein